MLRHLLPAVAVVSLAACALDAGSDELAVVDGSAEAVGVLRFLNSAAADVATLDDAAALDVRAARNIVAHVRGVDGALGTADDDLLGDLAELDAIPYVGPVAIDRLVAYVRTIGGVPDLDVEGVLLTQAEAAAIVAVASGATLAELDDAAGLDARAARGLVERRPFADVFAVAAVPYVGASALEKLRVFAAAWQAPPTTACDPQLRAGMRACVEAQLADDPGLAIDDAAAICADAELLGPVFDAACGGALPPGFCALSYEAFYLTAVPPCVDALAAELAPLCRAQADCGAAPMRCSGFAADETSALGGCVDMRARPGEGDDCHAHADCGAGLICAGLTLGGGGICVADWMQASYTTDLPRVIPAGAGAAIASTLLVIGQASVPMDLEVSAELTGVDPRRVRLVLADPSGVEAVVWDGATGGSVLPARMIALGAISRDDNVNGTWTLTATTLGAGAAGVLTSWQLHVTSRWD
ncbi:MAG: hypothetical protein IPL61_24440 [Myxococcales bacterium]|nr:hypothetical protein [Myxococcales bacterium]